MNLPRMSLHIGDYKKDTGHLRAAQHGAYMLLIMHYWATGSLPEDDAQLAAIACMTTVEWRKCRPVIFRLFQPEWRHKRIEQELAEARVKYERRAAAGRKGGTSGKRTGEDSASSHDQAMPKHCLDNATALPKQPLSLTLTKIEERDGNARTRATPLIRPEAHQLSDECLRAIGENPANPPDVLSGLTYQAEVWLARGYDPATVVAAFVNTATNYPPLKPVSYFAKAIESACAARKEPADVVTPARHLRSKPRPNNGDAIVAGMAAALGECAQSRLGGGHAGRRDDGAPQHHDDSGEPITIAPRALPDLS